METALTKEDYDAMKSLNEKIKNSMIEIGQKVYSQTQTDSSQASSDEAIETEFSTEWGV